MRLAVFVRRASPHIEMLSRAGSSSFSIFISQQYNSKMTSLITTRSLFSFPAPVRPLLAARLYATETGLGTTGTTQRSRRKAVTAFNDDGRVAWGDLTAREKAARSTQQTFNFSFIILGAVLTVCRAEEVQGGN